MISKYRTAQKLTRIINELNDLGADCQLIADRKSDLKALDASVHIQGAINDLIRARGALLAKSC
jgi:hypothetical protein